MAIEAALWRAEQQERRDLALAWHAAALSRAKRLPSLKQLLSIRPAKPLAGKELEERRRQHQAMAANIDLSRLVKKKAKHDDATR
jgi:hypothetical protein